MDVRRLQPHENVNTGAAEQIRALLECLPPDGPLPWFVFDAGYDSVQLAQGLVGARVAILVRLRARRSFYVHPLPRPPTGSPRRHGHKFDCSDAATWPLPTADVRTEDPRYGCVRVRAWVLAPSAAHGHSREGAKILWALAWLPKGKRPGKVPRHPAPTKARLAHMSAPPDTACERSFLRATTASPVCRSLRHA